MTRVIAPEPEIAAGGGEVGPGSIGPGAARPRGLRGWWRNPWHRPVGLAAWTWLYITWSLVPVLIAIQFSFNDGRSRTAWQGFSFRWYWGDTTRSVWHDPELRHAMFNSLTLALLTMLIATPLGVALALGLARWRGPLARGSNLLMLVPLATPEIVMGSMLFLVFVNLFTFVPLGRPAQLLGHVTFSLSYVVVIVRGRLLTIGREYEEAAQDLGASPMQAMRTVLFPMLGPAIFASLMIVFATSIDDFVISAFLLSDASSETVPVKLYSSVRTAPTPALNALATVMLVGTTLAIVLAVLGLRFFRRGERGSAVADFATLDL
jgi:spermidine/putrescine transport system permease protein